MTGTHGYMPCEPPASMQRGGAFVSPSGLGGNSRRKTPDMREKSVGECLDVWVSRIFSGGAYAGAPRSGVPF